MKRHIKIFSNHKTYVHMLRSDQYQDNVYICIHKHQKFIKNKIPIVNRKTYNSQPIVINTLLIAAH